MDEVEFKKPKVKTAVSKMKKHGKKVNFCLASFYNSRLSMTIP